MKIRLGFISNSSSSSFIISKKVLSEDQIEKIKNHIEYAQENFPQLEWALEKDKWTIEETNDIIRLSTCMNNFSMYDFLILINVKDEDIIYEG